jgi:hypothetical protein
MFKDEPWLTYGVLQGPKTLDLTVLSRGLLRNHHSSKPLLAQETLWPGNTFGHPKYTLDHVRKAGYVIHMSGAQLNFADMEGSSSSGFSGSMELAERVQERHDVIRKVWDFFETVPFHTMRPRQDLIEGGYALALGGEQYLVYLPTRGALSLKIAPGTYEAAWIDAQRTQDRKPLPAVTGTGEPVKFTTPDSGDDWLLHLTKRP